MTLGSQATEFINRKRAGLHLLAENIGKNLEREAKSKAPWRDRTGNTRRAIHGGGEQTKRGAVVYLAHGSEVGWYLEEGTGIYGPKKRPITPVRAKALRFTINGNVVFAKSVKGMPAQPVVEPTAKRKWPEIKRQVRRYWES